MINVKINNTMYRFPEHWGEVSLGQACELADLIEKEMPEELKLYFRTMHAMKPEQFEDHNRDVRKALAIQEVEWTEEHHFKIFPTFYGKVIKILSNVPQEIIDFINPVSRNVFYNQHLKQFVWGVMYQPYDFAPKGIKSFVVDKVTYHFPADADILGVQRPMGKNTKAVEFTEASDLLTFAGEAMGGKARSMANVIAILCRPMLEGKPEVYDEAVALERAKRFKEVLMMDVAWEVFFCITEQLNLFYQRITILQLDQAVSSHTSHSSNQGLNNLGGTGPSSKSQGLKESHSKKQNRNRYMTS